MRASLKSEVDFLDYGYFLDIEVLFTVNLKYIKVYL